MKVTGIVFSYNHEIWLNKNFRGTLINIDKMLNIWKQYPISNMLDSPNDLITETNKLFYMFVWNNRDKIKRETLISNIANGGAKVPDLQSILDTQKAIWRKRLLQKMTTPGKLLSTTKGDWTSWVGKSLRNWSKHKNFRISIKPYWINGLHNFISYPYTPNEVVNQYLWNNENIRTPDDKKIDYSLLKKAGINHVKYLIFNDQIMSLGKSHPYCRTSLEKFNIKRIIKCLPWPVSWK